MTDPNAPVVTRWRIRFSKEGALRFISHLDLHKLWERALRRSALPVRYSEGYSPRARLNLAAALPLGFASQAEWLDLWLNGCLTEDAVLSAITPCLPADIRIIEIASVDLKSPALQTLVHATRYQITIPNASPQALEKKVAEFLAQPEILRERRGKAYDLRPLVEHMAISPEGIISLQLTALPHATGRPEEVLDVLGIDFSDADICRVELMF